MQIQGQGVNSVIELLKNNDGLLLTNEDGIEDRLKLLPALSEQEIGDLESRLPCPLSPEVRELLQFAGGLDVGGGLGEINFEGLSEGFGREEIFPHPLPLCADGFGNYWIVDLTSESGSWGPIFYACHDAPVIVYQSESLLHFVEEAIRFGNEPWESEIDDVHEKLSNRIWRENPGAMDHAQCSVSDDVDIRAFAKSLDSTWQFVDLRTPRLGDGFSWGRYGPKTLNKRFGEKRIFAYQTRSTGRRLLDVFR